MSQRWYTREHEWVDVDGDEATVGITDFAQHQLGEIVYVDLPEPDDSFSAGEALAAVESVKTAADVYAPFNLTVTEVNGELIDAPELLNQNAEGVWLCRVRIENPGQIAGLLDHEGYSAILAAAES
ncbi:MAG: glycine cleavage system protein GcvH [Bacillota bacterium]|nr:glycine cleavage system protein GcvH [Bacillota bacterium]